MKLGTKREIRSAKAVAEARKLPRPIKILVLAYHEDEKGKPTTPMLERHFWVVGGVAEKICVHVDGQAKEHRFPMARGELDWSSKVCTVQDLEYDEEGKLLTITNVSHEQQYRMNTGSTNWNDWKFAYNTYGTDRSGRSNKLARIPRFKVYPDPKTGRRNLAGIIVHWQAQADSPDATWIDGKEPSSKQMETLQAEWDARGKKEAEKQAVGAATGPTDPSEMEGEDFDNGIIT